MKTEIEYVPDLLAMDCAECGNLGILYPVPWPGAFVCPTCTPHYQRCNRLCGRATNRRRRKLGLSPGLGGRVRPAGSSWYATFGMPVTAIRELALAFRSPNSDGIAA